MHNLVAFYESVTNGASYEGLSAVQDQTQTISASGYYISPKRQKVRGAQLIGVNLTAAQLNAPSLRQLGLPQIYPTRNVASIPSGLETPWWGEWGPEIQQTEEFRVDVSRAGADAQPVCALLWLYERFQPAPTGGPMFTAIATATITQVAGAWVAGQLAFTTQLQYGNYAVVGMRVQAADVFAARLVYPGSTILWRPGVIPETAYGDFKPGNPFRPEVQGHMGTFNSTAVPQLETLGIAAGAEVCTVYLNLVRLSN